MSADGLTHWSDFLRPVRRWTAQRKADLIEACRAGHLNEDEMLKLHGISEDEFQSWLLKYSEVGKSALRSTRLQDYPAARS